MLCARSLAILSCMLSFFILSSSLRLPPSTKPNALQRLKRTDTYARHTQLQATPADFDFSSLFVEGSVVRDMATVAVSSLISDTIAQSVESARKSSTGESTIKMSEIIDFKRSKRFLAFGFMDGFVGHNWFILLDSIIRGNDLQSTVERVGLDTVFFTPFWCTWFIVAMFCLTKLDKTAGEDVTLIGNLRMGYKELLYLDLGYFLPVACIVYSQVPLEDRVTAFSLANLLYTALVSAWAKWRLDKDGVDVVSKEA